MDTPQRKTSFGRSAGRLVSSTPGPVVSAPGPLAAGPGPLAAGSSPLTANPDSAFNNPFADINNSIVAQAYESINSVNPIAVKLPRLWRSKFLGWFAQAEAQFVTGSVTASLTKYYHIIKALKESYIKPIPELLTSPFEDLYMVLKHRLIEMYDLLDFHCTELVMALPLGLVTCAPPSFWTR